MPNRLLLKNKAWAEEKTRPNPNYFKNLSKGQKPRFFWIGCADSRVPVSTITQSEPADIFVHRNIANLALPSDISVMSSLQYAVEMLNVPFVIVCGHYGCGGIKAALDNQPLGTLDGWLQNIKDVYETHKGVLDQMKDQKDKADHLSELNVKTQAQNIANTATIQNAWENGGGPTILGWIFNIETGLLDQLLEIDAKEEIDASSEPQ